ncbi:carbohydrate sulfotransferase 5-like isoform X1 [Centruroides vittatus]|uniref:carbohydrate sulfotransferase 5-like isoform X1 n=2 Tax=Centruroides vittatus TaxID=120091 RepID=UPI003510A587
MGIWICYKIRRNMNFFKRFNGKRLIMKLFYVVIFIAFLLCINYLVYETGYYYTFTSPREEAFFIKNLSTTSLPINNYDMLHVLVLTYPRSGSSFVGKLLQSPSQAFYHFEPLHYLFDRKRSRSRSSGRSRAYPSKYPTPHEFTHDIFMCKYRNSFLNWAKNHNSLKILQRNERYWKSCSDVNGTNLCYNAEYFHNKCRNFTMQVAKTIRMSVSEAHTMLDTYKDLNLKIIHLLRDPRGIMNSRSKPSIASWCKTDITCYSSRVFCAKLDSDLMEAERILQKYPNRYLPLRYEELCCDMYRETERIFKFLGFGQVPKETTQFLHSHNLAIMQNNTSLVEEKYLESSYTTVRDSFKTAFAWRNELKFRNVKFIQRHCEKVMQKTNYAIVTTEGEMKDLNFQTILNTTACDRS